MSQPKPSESDHSILIVDDDAEFLDGARRALLAHGINNVTPLLLAENPDPKLAL